MLSCLMLPMRDGISLYTWCLCPDTPGKYPVLFCRTPYDTNDPIPDGTERRIAAAGYVVVHQSCRGTGRSEGVHVPFQAEREDGLDTLAWIRQQCWYNGEIYVYGGSYNAFVHLAYLDTCPEDVKGALLGVMPSNMYAALTVNGVFKQDVMVPWYILQYHKNQENTQELLKQYPAVTTRRPFYKAISALYRDGCPELETMLFGAPEDYPWTGTGCVGDARNALGRLKVPILILEGWYDIFVGQAQEMWNEIPEEVRAHSAMLIGPWPHGCHTEEAWDIQIPDGNTPEDLALNWFEHLRTGAELGFPCEGNIKYYTIGADGWSCMADFPQTEGQIWYLGEDGGLSMQQGAGEWRSWRYDPLDPTQFQGGANGFATVPSGIRAQPEPNWRPDLVSFVSAPLEEDLIITGRIAMELTVKSDREDTAFFVRIDVQKNGKFLPIQESIIYLSSQNPGYQPGTEAKLRMKTDATAWKLCKGDRLRVDVASSNWPVYSAHGNVAGFPLAAEKVQIAQNEVKTGQSWISLPVIAPNGEK